MRMTLVRPLPSKWQRAACALLACAAVFFMAAALLADPGDDPELKVLKTGLGSGTVTSSPAGISCGADCDENYASTVTVTLTATPAPGSTFAGWDVDADGDAGTTADCTGTSSTCVVAMTVARFVRPVFNLDPDIPALTDLTPTGIQTYLTANPAVNSPARFIKALPDDFKQNWILMSRSESLQTGIAESPRILLPSADARAVFTVGMRTSSSYPGSHPNAVEYMQWDAAEKNFRFHEIVLDAVPAMASIPARSRGVSVDDAKCSKCHSTQNVINRTSAPGTTGIPPGTVKVKNKPNWDSYDSWGGMTPFNRDRIYQGSVEAASFRKIFNPWTWNENDAVRQIIEQLRLQPLGVVSDDAITRLKGGANDGMIKFAFDATTPVTTEPVPAGTDAAITTNYSFNNAAGTGAATSAERGGSFVHLRHTNDVMGTGVNVEGRGVELFDHLGGLNATPNAERIADELISHRFATGSFPIDIRPVALAITKRCLDIDEAANAVTSSPALTIDLSFFDNRNGLRINELVADTRARAESLPRRKADIQKIGLDRSADVYLSGYPAPSPAVAGLIQQHGAATAAGTDTALARLRQDVFRRPLDLGGGDNTVMGGIYVDRELHTYNTPRMALYRYFLEPLGVSVDKWSMGVRGRSRTYTFADVFGSYENILEPRLSDSLTSNPVAGLSPPFECANLIPAVNSTLASLPAAAAVPTYTDVQRIFNKSCIECHGNLRYPPYENFGSVLDVSEDEAPPSGGTPLTRPYNVISPYATSLTAPLYRRITRASENCPFGMMPCGGPPLSRTDVETIRRWIEGGNPYTEGDPHIKTVDGINYDFQSAGEFVLLRDEGTEIQARHTPVETDSPLGPNPHTGLSSCVSVNSAVAVRAGAHRVTYQPNLSGQPDPGGLQLRIDGKLMTTDSREILLPSGGRIVRTTTSGGLRIDSPGGMSVIVTPNWWDNYQLWYMNIDVRRARATQGVMGAIGPGNWLPALPDGTSLGPKPDDLNQRYLDLYVKFANAWRVTDATSLFDYAPGTSTKTFTVESWPEESPRACAVPRGPLSPPRPPAKALAPEVAQQLCADIAAEDRKLNCVQDTMVTGEAGFAKTYLMTEQIERNADPAPPTLAAPDDNDEDLGRPATFTWNVTADKDGGGGALTYRYCVWPVDKTFTFNDCYAEPIQAQATAVSPRRRIFYALLAALVGFLLLLLLLYLGLKKKPLYLALAAAVILAAVVIVFYVAGPGGPPATLSRTVAQTSAGAQLEPGKSYFWKVIAEDSNGALSESETRRFTAR